MSKKHFTQEEHECLAYFLLEGRNYSEIGRILGKHRSTIQREVTRNFSRKHGHYNPWRAYSMYKCRRKSCVRKPAIRPGSKEYLYIMHYLEERWPPEVIAARGKREGIYVSCSTIYRAIKKGVFGKWARKTFLRRRGKNRHLVHHNTRSIRPVHTIHDRPAIVETKGRFGDWEGDTVYGAVGKGCLVTAVERKSKLLVAAISPSRKQEDIREAFSRAFKRLEVDIPIETLTLDNGSEFAAFLEIEKDLNTTIYFADPHSPWQRGLIENTNDLLRFYFPKGTNFLLVSDDEVAKVVSSINSRPRKGLGFLSPLEFLSSCCI